MQITITVPTENKDSSIGSAIVTIEHDEPEHVFALVEIVAHALQESTNFYKG